MDSRAVQQYFSRYAQGFDAIYSGHKNGLLRLVDQVFRQDMYGRMALTLQSCGDVGGKEVLDIGCGSGRYAVPLAKFGARVTGIDFAGSMLELARQNAQAVRDGAQPAFLEGDFLTHPIEPPFDIALAIGFFDYTRDATPFLQRARQLTRERLIATFPRLWTHRAALRKVRLSLSGCPVYFYRLPQVRQLVEASGFTIGRIVPLANSFWVEARSK